MHSMVKEIYIKPTIRVRHLEVGSLMEDEQSVETNVDNPVVDDANSQDDLGVRQRSERFDMGGFESEPW